MPWRREEPSVAYSADGILAITRGFVDSSWLTAVNHPPERGNGHHPAPLDLMVAHLRPLYLAPDLLGAPNGIARYCALVHQAMRGADLEPTVVALHDKPGIQTATGGPVLPRYFPCSGSRTLFAARALQIALLERPSVVVVGHPHLCTLGLAISKAVSARLVVFVYGVDIWVPLQLQRRWAIQQADRVIAISHFTAERARQANKIDSSKLRVLFNCLDPALVRTEKNVATAARPVLLTVARINRLENFKGHDIVMRALPDVLRQHPSLIYEVVGDGDARPELEALAQRLGVERSVKFRGIVSDSELSTTYRHASIMVMPSAREGFGFVFLEAMAHGTPVIGGNLDATPEVVTDGETGLVVDPRSVTAVRDAILRILSDDALRRRMGEASAARALEFGFDAFQSQLVNHLREVVG